MTPAPPRPTLRELLRPLPTVRPPFAPSDLGTAAQAWAALVRDADVTELRPGFAVVPGTQVTAGLRALALAHVVPAGVVVGRASAVWVHTGHGDQERVCVLYPPGGHRPRDPRRLQACQATVRPWEILTLATGPERSLAVTSLTRTAMDVATWCEPQESAELLTHLVGAGLDVDDALHRLDLVASWRGAERARARLLAARAQARSSGLEPVIR